MPWWSVLLILVAAWVVIVLGIVAFMIGASRGRARERAAQHDRPVDASVPAGAVQARAKRSKVS
ncbi:hypothetical protein [Specibacter cremeus]|uniref:hypothetical protein n=1 Tax=Specibacter cremeus TaxID=1629051 RepID=UPI000F7A7A21|nr:hypothetical protein [Specibacter cremeus]